MSSVVTLKSQSMNHDWFLFYLIDNLDVAVLVEGHPFVEGLGAVLEHGVVRQGEGLFRDRLVIGVPGRIRIKAMYDQGDEGQLELRHGGCVQKVLGGFIKISSFDAFPHYGAEMEGSHARGVWLRKNSSQAEDLLTVRRRILGFWHFQEKCYTVLGMANPNRYFPLLLAV